MPSILSPRMSLADAATLLRAETDAQLASLQARRAACEAEMEEIDAEIVELNQRRQEIAQFLAGRGKP